MVSGLSTYRSKKSGAKSQHFPQRLHNLMEYVEQQGLQHVITWVFQGRGVMIHNPDGLVKLLPLFFSQTKYRSFRRQLNMWHFERIESGPHKGAFIHPYFVRDDRELSSCMSRQVSLKEPRRDPTMISIEPETFALDSDILDSPARIGEDERQQQEPHDHDIYYPTTQGIQGSNSTTCSMTQKNLDILSQWLEPNPLVHANNNDTSSSGDLSKFLSDTTTTTNSSFPHKILASNLDKKECWPQLTTSYPSSTCDKEDDMMMIPMNIIETETRMALKSFNNIPWNRLFSETPSSVRMENFPLEVDLDDFDLDVADLFTVV
eukprot:Nitzschia sp. Nitz4//scaffold57_size113557//97646//98602//NITZ4_004007-RA/size113557-processed-gene-0.19-mRNA-1//1//CDS//3329554894//463//frame0